MYPSFGNVAPAEMVKADLRDKTRMSKASSIVGIHLTSAVRTPARNVNHAIFSLGIDDLKVGVTRSILDPVIVMMSSGNMIFMNQ
jgi:hypothetical protein